MGSAPETRSWMDNWNYQKKMDILRVADRSVTLLEEPWRKSFEKYRKCCDFDDFWAFFTNSAGGRSGCGPKISTYILFGSISTQNVRFWNNLAWSRGLRGPRSESTAPGQGVCAWCVLECACRPAGAVRAEQISRKSEKRTKTRAASVQMCCISIFFGNFNRPRNQRCRQRNVLSIFNDIGKN